MNADWKKVKDIFRLALECDTDKRPLFLDAACAGNPSLREEVESLLEAHEKAESFLETSPLGDRLVKKGVPDPGVTKEVPGPGTKVNERYVIEKRLGQGGIGVVFRARDEQVHNQPVAVKFLQTADLKSWTARKFKHESEALTRINHPGVVKVLDRGLWNDKTPFLVMEFVEGVTLRSLLKPKGMDLATVAVLVRQIGEALDAAHSEGIIHRDLKPTNIMLQKLSGGGEQVKLIDFGLARLENPISAEASHGFVRAGTVGYMAPEQIERGEFSPASDVFVFAIIAHEMLTGQRPSVSATLLAKDFFSDSPANPGPPNPPKTPTELRPDLPPAAETALFKALALSPRERYKTAGEFGNALARALTDSEESRPTGVKRSGTETHSARRTLGERLKFEVVRKKTVFVPLIVLALACAIWAGFTIFRAPPPAPSANNPVQLVEAARVFFDTVDSKGVKKRKSTADLFSGDEQIWMNVVPRRDGYLYVLAPGENNFPMLLLTGRPETGSETARNRATAGTVFRFPDSDTAMRVGGDGETEVFTVVFSPTPLARPAFFTAEAGRSLNATESLELDRFVTEFKCEAIRPTANDLPVAPATAILVNNTRSPHSPLVFKLSLRKK